MLRYGCLGVGGLVLVTLLFVSVVAYVTALPEQVEDHILIPEIPAEVTAGRILLEIREAELRVEPVALGEPLRVEAHYDLNIYVLEEELDPGTDGSGDWTYRVTLERSDRAGAFAGLVSLVRGSTPSIHLFLPADVPLDLVLEMKEGGAVVRLGGLWLRTATIDLRSGALDLDVDEPLREPMERLSISTAKGGCLLNHIGNASPRRLDVSYRTGVIDMDLGGLWLADAEIHIDGRTGGGTAHLPAGVILEGLDLGSIQVPASTEVNLPRLRFSVSTGLGYLEYSDIHLRDRPLLD